MSEARYVVVLTKCKAIHFGERIDDGSRSKVILRGVRQAVQYTAASRGLVGLAALGPGEGSKITPSAPRIEIRNVAAILELTDRAVAQWQSARWEGEE